MGPRRSDEGDGVSGDRDSAARLYFNGIDGATGGYDLPPMTAEQLARLILGEKAPDDLAELRDAYAAGGLESLGREEMMLDLAAAGWGVVFAQGGDPAVEEALAPLLARRREQAGDLFRCFRGDDGARPNESKTQWLARHGMGPGAPQAEVVPNYLLLVGSPEAIPFRFQSQLDVRYAVGRLDFDAPEEYAHYAASVLAAEDSPPKRPRRATFFGAINGDDPATNRTARFLVQALEKEMGRWGAEEMGRGGEGEKGRMGAWEVEGLYGAEASKAALRALLGGGRTPSLLFTGSHGHKLPMGDPRQRATQGALICSDWPGPFQWSGGPIPPEHYLSADDLDDAADLSGLIAFFYACYGGGTPLVDEFVRQSFNDRPSRIAAAPFVAELPRRMLSRPQGGALAVVSHVERVWNCSYEWPGAGFQTAVFESCLRRLMNGYPVGLAFEEFDLRYAELSTVLSDLIEANEAGEAVDYQDLAFNWTANNDARGYVIIGDPAVRIGGGVKG